MRHDREVFAQLEHVVIHTQAPPLTPLQQLQNRQHSLLHCETGAPQQAVVPNKGLGRAAGSVVNLLRQDAQQLASQ
jgi:hypothetical protein